VGRFSLIISNGLFQFKIAMGNMLIMWVANNTHSPEKHFGKPA